MAVLKEGTASVVREKCLRKVDRTTFAAGHSLWSQGIRLSIWVLVCWLCGLSVGLAQAPQSLPTPAAPVLQATAFPQAVYLGKPFSYRLRLKLPSSTRVRPPSKRRIGAAHLVGQIKAVPRQGQLVLKLPLAVYVVRQYGPTQLPPFALTFIQADGSTKRLWLPGPRVEVRARYAATRQFRLLQDPALPFLKGKRTGQPSHEWRALPLEPSSPTRRPLPWLWIAIGSGALLLLLAGIGRWYQKRPQAPAEVPDPYQEAKQRLLALGQQPPTDRESLRERCAALHRTLRSYLQHQLDIPTQHLSAGELIPLLRHSQLLQGSDDPMSATPAHHEPPWVAPLAQWLQKSEPACFGPPFSLQHPPDAFAPLHQQAQELLEVIETWVQQHKPTPDLST